MHVAVENQAMEVWKVLMSFKADTKLKNADGKTPLDLVPSESSNKFRD